MGTHGNHTWEEKQSYQLGWDWNGMFLGEQMDGEWVFLLKVDHWFEPISLYNRLVAWNVPSDYFQDHKWLQRGMKPTPLKACGWFSGWSFPLGRCWVIKLRYPFGRDYLVPAQNFNFQARFFLKNSCKKTTTSEKSFFCCWKYSNQILPTIHFWDTFLRQGFYSSTIPGNHWYKSNRIKSGYSWCTSPRP